MSCTACGIHPYVLHTRQGDSIALKCVQSEGRGRSRDQSARLAGAASLAVARAVHAPRPGARVCVTTGGMKRQVNQADRRGCIVHLSLESLRKLEGVYKSKAELLSGVTERYKDRDLRVLIEFFQQVNGGGVGK